MKVCSMCKCKKGLNDFCINRSSLDGLNSRCRACCATNRRRRLHLEDVVIVVERVTNFIICFD